MAVSRSVLKAYAYQLREPSEVLSMANHILYDDSRVGMFVTVFYGVLDLESCEFRYANAGHNMQYVYRGQTNQIIFSPVEVFPWAYSQRRNLKPSR